MDCCLLLINFTTQVVAPHVHFTHSLAESGALVVSVDHTNVIGNFHSNKDVTEKTIIVRSFLSALILEEIAIDTPIRQKEEEILKEAQELHLASLDLAR